MAQLIQRASILFAAVICVASPALAQNARARGPFAGLFGGGQRAENSQSLDFRTSLFGVWQDVLIPQDFDRTLLDPRFELSGTFGGVSGFLDYAFNRHTESSSVFVNGRTWTSDYSNAPGRPQFGAEVLTGLTQSVRLTRRMSLASTVTASYSPFFDFGPLAQALNNEQNVLPTTSTPGLGFAGVGAENVAITGSTGVSQALSRRSTIAGNLVLQHVSFLGQSSSDLTQLSGNANYTHQLFRKLNFRVGYQAWQSHVSNPPAWTGPTQSLDFGLDYGDGGRVQLTRRTTLTFGASLGSARVVPGKTVYRALGTVGLSRTFGRTWVGSAGVFRTLQFIAAFQEPVLLDGATASLGGQLFTRVSWTSMAEWSRGSIGLVSARKYDTAFGASSLSFGITRWLGAFAQYSYYRTSVAAGSTALSALTNLDRQTISAGLSLYTPIYHSRRNMRTTP